MEGGVEGGGGGGGGVFQGVFEGLEDEAEAAGPVAGFPGGFGDGEEGVEFGGGNEGFQAVSDHGGGAAEMGVEDNEDQAVEAGFLVFAAEVAAVEEAEDVEGERVVVAKVVAGDLDADLRESPLDAGDAVEKDTALAGIEDRSAVTDACGELRDGPEDAFGPFQGEVAFRAFRALFGESVAAVRAGQGHQSAGRMVTWMA